MNRENHPIMASGRSLRFWIFFLALILPAQAHANGMTLIPGGTFQMGSMEGGPDEQPVHTVHVDPFYIDHYLVTNADYARFLNVFGNRVEEGKKWLDNVGPLSSWLCKIQKKDGRFVPKPGYEDHPVIKVSWYGARAYARWVGKRLLTEAEWERAAGAGWRVRNMPAGTRSALPRRILTVSIQRPRSVLTPPMDLDCTTWWPVSGSGVMTGTIQNTMPNPPRGIRKGQKAVH